jgi:hypothetical protein
MPANNTYIEDSLELNLFYLRIMKEHALFLQLAFTPKNKDLGVQAESIRLRMDDLMRQTMQVSRGYLREAAMPSGELFTRYTEEAERQTQNLTGVLIDMQLTLEEYNLGGVVAQSSSMQQTVDGINYSAASLTGELLQLKLRVQSDVAACAMFTSIYPLQIDHLIREAEDYLSMLNRLNARQLQMGPQELADEQALMDGLMGEHALFIDGLLDPAETALKMKARAFYPEFHRLSQQATAAKRAPGTLPVLTRRTIPAVQNIVNFKAQGAEGILSCKIRSIILPLLADHVLREANYYLRILKETLGR